MLKVAIRELEDDGPAREATLCKTLGHTLRADAGARSRAMGDALRDELLRRAMTLWSSRSSSSPIPSIPRKPGGCLPRQVIPSGAGSNASARLEAYVSKGGAYTSGVIPEVEDLFQRQVRELDVKLKRP